MTTAAIPRRKKRYVVLAVCAAAMFAFGVVSFFTEKRGFTLDASSTRRGLSDSNWDASTESKLGEAMNTIDTLKASVDDKLEAVRTSLLRGPLTAKHIADYHEDGYLVLRAHEWLTAEEKANLLRWAKEVQEWPEKKYHWMKYYETSSKDGSRILNRVENYIPYHEGLNNIFNGSKSMDILHQILGAPAVLYKDKINMKLPGAGGFEPHQDMLAGWGAYNVDNFVTFSVSIDHAHEKNGALECVRGHHKMGKLADDWTGLNDTYVQAQTWNMVKTAPGDVIIFDAFVPHRSAPNNDTSSRQNLYLTYNKAAEGDHRLQYYIDKRKNYPPDNERLPGIKYEYKI